MTPPRPLLILLSLYVAQGMPTGFLQQALPVVMRSRGLSLEEIGLASALALPWSLKLLWAPWIDRTLSPRVWITAMQVAAVGLLLVLSAFDPGVAPAATMALLLGLNTVSATQDIATDGLATRTLTSELRGAGNSVQVAGFRVGMILGGGALLFVYGRLGWTGAMVGMAAWTALCSLPLLAAPSMGARAAALSAPSPRWWGWFRLPGAGPWVGLLAAWKVGDYLASGMLRPWMVDHALSTDDIAWRVGILGFAAGLAGAAAAGAATRALSRRAALAGFGALQASGVAAYAAVVGLDHVGHGLTAAIVYEHFVGGLGTVALFTAMMDASRVEEAGADYTAQASVVVLTSGLASALSGVIAERAGYNVLFITAAAAALIGPSLALLPGMWRVHAAVADGGRPADG
jgi:PAT family beta-lactamase induction signal transducer AmpG